MKGALCLGALLLGHFGEHMGRYEGTSAQLQYMDTFHVGALWGTPSLAQLFFGHYAGTNNFRDTIFYIFYLGGGGGGTIGTIAVGGTM